MFITEASQLLRQRAVSPVELTQQCLARIEQLESTLNTFIRVTAESALTQARQAEEEILRGEWRGPLHGIPIGIKDNIDIVGLPTTCGSRLFENRIAEQDGEVVSRLRNAGAIILGKQTMHEFAYGGSSLVSYYGDVHNPWDPAHIAGGSSGGSASAVAAGLGFAAVGTDTGGSVREPAALCGVVGLKPTYGLLSARGVFPLAPSLDHVGPIARSVADVTIMLEAMTGTELNLDPSDSAVRIGIPRRFFFEDIDSEVAAAVEQAISVLAALHNRIEEMNEINLRAATDRCLLIAEAYAVHKDFVATSSDFYQPETLRRILAGKSLVESGEAERRKKELVQARHHVAELFEHVDVILTPTTPLAAPQIAKLKSDPEQLRPAEVLLLRNTRPFNFWGLPAISVPCGFTRQGLPIGLQIIGPPRGENQILNLAQSYEQATEWHHRTPSL